MLGRIYSNMKTFHLCLSFHSFTLPVCLISELYCEEKLDSGHYRGCSVKLINEFVTSNKGTGEFMTKPS